MYVAEDLNLGMGGGILVTSIAVRLLFTPLVMYAQKNGLKYRLIMSDIEKIKRRQQILFERDDNEAAIAEGYKIRQLKKKWKIRPGVAYFNILQFPIHIAAFLL